MNRLFLISIVMVAAFLPALGQTREDKSTAAVRKAIESSTQKFVEAFTKGDAPGIAAMYAEGAKVMPPQSPLVQGRRPIQDLWQGLIDTGAKISLSTTDVESRGDLAFEVGTYKLTFTDGKVDTGKFIVVWKRQKDRWKLFADIWNSDLPIPAQ